MIARPAPGADEPFPLATQIDELPAGQLESVQGDRRLERGHHDRRAAA